jgi:hypothetical protein
MGASFLEQSQTVERCDIYRINDSESQRHAWRKGFDVGCMLVDELMAVELSGIVVVSRIGLARVLASVFILDTGRRKMMESTAGALHMRRYLWSLRMSQQYP